jgi:alkylation response protein AidB-like acyl-CoA dehydrogenase
MRFDLDEQQRAFQETVAEYLAAECPISRVIAAHDSGAADLDLWQGLMELGIGGLLVPEQHGGLGLGLLDQAAVAEVLGRHAAPGPFFEHALATLALVEAGTPEQRGHWLPGMAAGEVRGTLALAESKGEWDASEWQLDPIDGRLTGTKRHVLHVEGVDLIIVGLSGGRLALVRGDAEGLSITPVPATDAGHPMANLEFKSAPCELLQGAAGRRILDAGLILLAADAYGGAERSVQMAVEYAKERVQFDQPIGAFQALKHQLADMAIRVYPAVGLYWYAAHAFDVRSDDASVAAARAKAYLTEVYPQIARRMIEAHGGVGYTWEFGVHAWLKRALFDQAYLGMPRAQRIRLAEVAGW